MQFTSKSLEPVVETIPGTIISDQTWCVFKMAPEYRRCGIYLIVGYFVLGGASLSVRLEGLDRDWESSVSRALLLAPFMLAPALLTFRQVLRVDGNGIWRRRFFRWDLWNWDAFAGGQIRAGSSSPGVFTKGRP